MQDSRQGVGPMYQRRYTVRISGSPMTPAQLIEHLGVDLNAASPVEVAVFDKTSGASQPLELGDEYVVHMPGPWNCPVRVVERTPESFRFATLSGHMEAGEIEFRARSTERGGLEFTVESWARSGDRLAEILYKKVGLAKEMQLHMWAHFCGRVAELSGGHKVGDVEVQTERADISQPGRQGLLARTLTTAFTRTFVLATRFRDRPLHPRGLVFDATLLLHGTSQYWGVPFLDDRTQLRGRVRLSRAVGLPPMLPDILGLALRWRQHPADEAQSELLLATTGHTRLGRHLLRPATRWSPAFYGSLLPYRAGDRKILLGAVARPTRTVPAGLPKLARALDERPLMLDLVVATEFGAWEPFGELRLQGPARNDDTAPMRFNPTRNPIKGLRPVGLFQQVRAPTYNAVQQAGTARPHRRREKALFMRKSRRARRRMQRLHANLSRLSLNFDPRRPPDRAGNGWRVDDYRQPLPAEPPGPPIPGGSWETARDLVRDYQYADPGIIREICRSGPPEPGRNMLLEGRFYGLRFHLGLRVGNVVDGVIEQNGRRARVWGWNYRTLQGHLERGQMDQEVRKWLDTGEVEFHIHSYSQRAPIRNPIVRLGFVLFGRLTQIRFYRRACRRMETLTKATLAHQQQVAQKASE
ncbi:DUF1990 family protein [Actinomadura graeca]|uniref:DUF1990 family protein n=1 Tax=Actinomadura graeca TaxID=2750812 RepID=A0ABX8QZS0_9ACTN|nr:DUF1990 family protein [Actinomadura graeca]QXJ24227.1 DUF1990 family protein [Actinomadura graeca]